jgi:hypothetical protein
LASCLGSLCINLLGSLCQVCQDGHLVWQDVHKAAVDGKVVFFISRPRAQLALCQLRDERYVMG